MARGRMISKSLSTSERFAALYDAAGKLAEFCQSLYPLLVAHADDWGCLAGDVFTVKHLVHPTSPRRAAEFEVALHALDTVGLVTWYEVDGKRYLAIAGWFAHQQLRGHDDRKRPIPPPPENVSKNKDFAQIRPDAPKSALREENRTEQKGREQNRTALRAEFDLLRAAFERFWEAYPKKVGKDAAWGEFQKRAPGDDLTDQMITAVQAQRASAQWQKDDGQYIPNPRTWLHQGRWQDEGVERRRNPRLEPNRDDGEDWFEECKRVHAGACELDRYRHMTRIAMERTKVEA